MDRLPPWQNKQPKAIYLAPSAHFPSSRLCRVYPEKHKVLAQTASRTVSRA
ncbi:hypothetical protein ACSS6W_003783 [Trichoderma asperelloides]